MKRKKIFLFFLFLFFLLFSFTFAQELKYPKVSGGPTITATSTFTEYAKYLFNFFIFVSGLVALGVLIWAGILWLTSAGDPSKIEEAKTKAIGAFLGLIILVFSYVIVITINPTMRFFHLKKLSPNYGIYIIDSTTGEKGYIGGSTGELPFSNVNKIEFISPPGTLKEVYLYDQKNFQGNYQKVENNGGVVNVSPPINSIYFFENYFSLHLFNETDFKLSNQFKYPKQVWGEVDNLGRWNAKTASIKVIGATSTIEIGAFLFSKTDLRGECGYFRCEGTQSEISNLSTGSGDCTYNNAYGMGNDKLSSLLTFVIDSNKEYSGRVIFYEDENCQATSSEKIISNGFEEGSFPSKTKSFKVEGNFRVILVDTDHKICQGKWSDFVDFETKCVKMIKGTHVDVYDPEDPNIRPTYYYVIPG
jgi:hypothetical protein